MRDTDAAASFAISLAKQRGQPEVTADELLLGCLHAISQFGIAQLGTLVLDLEELGVEWLNPADGTAPKVRYSKAVVSLIDQAARIASAEGGGAVGVEHILAAFAREESGLMGELKRKYEITSASWRASIAQLSAVPATRARSTPKEHIAVTPSNRDYLSPEEAAETLGIHVQTVRAYIRSGKLPALRVAGERAIRIRRKDLDAVLEPLVPQP